MFGKYDVHIMNNGGFSLIEVLILIVVIGIAAGSAVQWMSGSVDDVRKNKTEREMEMLATAITGDPEIISDGERADFGYVGDIGAFPSNLQALYQNPGGYSTWDGPYIEQGFQQDNTGFLYDEWGVAYNYSGGIVIASTGGGSTLTKKIADATSDYLLNHFNGQIRDASGNRPGALYADSIDVVVTIPNGSGGFLNKTYQPTPYGIFTLDSIPVGKYPLRIIYNPAADTLLRYLTILPRNKSEHTYKFAFNYFAGSTDTVMIALSTTGSATLGGLGFNDEDIVNYNCSTDVAVMMFNGSSAFSNDEDVDAFHILENGHIVLSTTSSALIGGVWMQNEDLVEYDTTTGTAVMLFDGSTIFSNDEDIDAAFVTDSGTIMLSTTGSASIGSLSFQDEDIVEYDRSTGTATMYFDGSTAFTTSADIDAIFIQNNGHIILSVNQDNRQLGGLSFNAEDLADYDPSSGTATMYFDGNTPFGTNNEDIDGVHIGDGVGSTDIGSVSTTTLRPDGNGAMTGLTNSGCYFNYQCVDESSSDDDATRVVRASNWYGTDVYSLENPSDTSGSIISVTVYCRARRTHTQGQVALALYTNSSVYYGNEQNLSGSYDEYSEVWTTNPHTGSSWTWTEIINLQAGIEIRGQNWNFPAYCTQVWVEISTN